jgi:hypothetical protein
MSVSIFMDYKLSILHSEIHGLQSWYSNSEGHKNFHTLVRKFLLVEHKISCSLIRIAPLNVILIHCYKFTILTTYLSKICLHIFLPYT